MQMCLKTTNPKCCHLLLPPHPPAPPVVSGAANFSTTASATARFRQPTLRASSTTTTAPPPPPPPPKPLRRRRRKNQLRSKILKTLIKPFPTAPLPEITTTTTPTIDIPIETLANDVVPRNDLVSEPGQLNEIQSVSLSEGTVGNDGKFISTKSVLKFCGYFVLVFVFQTICAVMILGHASFDDEDEKKKKMREAYLRSLDDGVAVLDEAEVEFRVNEIRAMARAVREGERRERDNERGGGGRESEREIEKEIGERLVRLERKLNSKREKLPNSVIDYLGYGSDDEDDVEDNEGSNDDDNDKDFLKMGEMQLMFKKKFQFKSPGINAGSDRSPKGFGSRQGDYRGQNVSGGSKVSNVAAVSLQNNKNELDKNAMALKKEMGPSNVLLLSLKFF